MKYAIAVLAAITVILISVFAATAAPSSVKVTPTPDPAPSAQIRYLKNEVQIYKCITGRLYEDATFGPVHDNEFGPHATIPCLKRSGVWQQFLARFGS